MAIRRPMKSGPPKATLTPISGSLPITMSKPKPLPSMASIFGKKNDVVSKSWSDLWDEDIEEEEEVEKQIKVRQMQNARTWSHESSKNEDDTIREPLREPKGSSFVNIQKFNTDAGRVVAHDDIDGDLVADGFFFHDTPKKTVPQSPRYSPPPKRTTFDKWSALGQRRRAYTGTSESEKSPEPWKARRQIGLGFAGFGAGVWDNKTHAVVITKDFGVKDHKAKVCPWDSAKSRDHYYHGKDRHWGDSEWVGASFENLQL